MTRDSTRWAWGAVVAVVIYVWQTHWIWLVAACALTVVAMIARFGEDV